MRPLPMLLPHTEQDAVQTSPMYLHSSLRSNSGILGFSGLSRVVTPLWSPSSTHLVLRAMTQRSTHSHVIFPTPLCASWRPGSCLSDAIASEAFWHQLTSAGYLPVQANVGTSELLQKKALQARLWISILFLKKDFILSYLTCIWGWGYVHM